MHIFKSVFNNPGKAAVVIFTVVLAIKTFVIPGESSAPGDDLDLQGIASPHVDQPVLIEPVE